MIKIIGRKTEKKLHFFELGEMPPMIEDYSASILDKKTSFSSFFDPKRHALFLLFSKL